MTKLDELKEILRLNRLMAELLKECQERLQVLKPGGLQEFAIETERKVAELEILQHEAKELWAVWKGKYPNG
jgi:hypothetical protein